MRDGAVDVHIAFDAPGEVGVLASALGRTLQSLRERTDALLVSREELKQVTDNMPALISCIDREQRFRFANRVYSDWLGFDPAKMIGNTGQVGHGRRARAIRLHARRDGRATSSGGTCRSQRQLQTIADSIPALVAYIDCDERFRFVDVAVGRTFGTPAARVMGRSVADVRGAELPVTSSIGVPAATPSRPPHSPSSHEWPQAHFLTALPIPFLIGKNFSRLAWRRHERNDSC